MNEPAWADETISSWAHRRALSGKPFISSVINALFFDNAHCAEAYESERTDRHQPPELRD